MPTVLMKTSTNVPYSIYKLIFIFNSGETWDRARKLKDKMATNLVMAKDRLDFLGMYIKPVYEIGVDVVNATVLT